MVEAFRQGGTVVWDKDRLNILVKTPVSWFAQSFSTLPVTPSGPAAFLWFTVLVLYAPDFMLLHSEDVAAVSWWM